MNRRLRRRSGVALLILLAVQSVAAPMGACAQEHEGHDTVAPEMATNGHGHANMPTGTEPVPTEASHHDPASAPVGCLALAACGAPAISTSIATAVLPFADRVEQKARGILDEPAVIVLGLTTPPPKI